MKRLRRSKSGGYWYLSGGDARGYRLYCRCERGPYQAMGFGGMGCGGCGTIWIHRSWMRKS